MRLLFIIRTGQQGNINSWKYLENYSPQTGGKTGKYPWNEIIKSNLRVWSLILFKILYPSVVIFLKGPKQNSLRYCLNVLSKYKDHNRSSQIYNLANEFISEVPPLRLGIISWLIIDEFKILAWVNVCSVLSLSIRKSSVDEISIVVATKKHLATYS